MSAQSRIIKCAIDRLPSKIEIINRKAITVGVADGLQLGTNAKSALIARSLKEIIAVGTHLGGKTETFWGLAGLGDLLATCSSSIRQFSVVQIKSTLNNLSNRLLAQKSRPLCNLSHLIYLN